MKRRLLSLIVPALALIASGALLSGCDDNDTGADYINEFYTIGRSEWILNEDYDRYEVFKSNPNVDDYMYEYGLSDGYMWIQDLNSSGREIEARKQLPYTLTYSTQNDYWDLTYDYDIRPGGIMFEIRSIDGIIPRNFLPSEIDFKVSLMWRR